MRPIMAVIAALALLAAACSDGAADAETLDEFMGEDEGPMGLFGPAARPSEQQQREIEEHIAECMAEEGFEYRPRDPGDRPSRATIQHPRQEMEEDEFREEYGYGISTWRPDPEERSFEPPEDPNHEILEEMDDAERDAYHEALHGRPPIDPSEHEPGEMPAPDEHEQPEGCRDEAREEVLGEQLQLREELHDAMDELHDAMESDPRMVEAEREWSECMRERGWDVDAPMDAHQLIFEEHRELRQAHMPEVEMPGPNADPEELEDFEPPEPDIPEEALEELQQRELDIAADDHECAEATELDEVREEVRVEHEGEFIEEHRDELERLTEQQ